MRIFFKGETERTVLKDLEKDHLKQFEVCNDEPLII